LLKKLQEKIQEINEAYGDLQDMQKEILKTFV
jgi:membrane protein insertase Oxa1/YidC/SpoIIIJ